MTTTDNDDDDRLLLAARSDAQSFARFYRRHAAPLTGYFLRRTRNPEVAADLTAETFAAALDGLHRFKPDRGPAAAWLYGIARRKLSDWAERGAVEERGRRRLGMTRLELSDEELDRVEQLADINASHVSEHLAALPPDQGDAVRRRIVDEAPYAEIAAAQGASEALVRQRVSRGLAGLRARLRRSEMAPIAPGRDS